MYLSRFGKKIFNKTEDNEDRRRNLETTFDEWEFDESPQVQTDKEQSNKAETVFFKEFKGHRWQIEVRRLLMKNKKAINPRPFDEDHFGRSFPGDV